jgi:sulfite exporter TauE/SafE
VKVYIDVFIMGVALSWGPCLSFCAPILLPYIAATQKGWRSGLKATLAFSISRIVPYVILALISSSLGQYLVRNFLESRARLIIQILAAVFVLLVGVVVLIGRSPRLSACQLLSRHIGQEGIKGMILLGFLVGMLPCMPLLGLLTYIAFTSKSLLEGAFLGLAFGIGTLISPLLLFGPLAGGISSILFKKPLIYKVFNRICGLILMYLGIWMMIRIFNQ